MNEIINNRFRGLGLAGTYAGHGENGAQFAADFWSTNKLTHDAVLKWVIANAKDLGILYIISWERIWSVARASEGIRTYRRDFNGDGILSASERHTNHVHISYDPEKENMAISVNLSDATIEKIAKRAAALVWSADVIPNWGVGDKTTNPALQAKNAVGEIGKQTK